MNILKAWEPQIHIILKGLVILFVVVFTLHPSADLDLGWHLRYGQYFFQTGHVLKDNIISFVWPNYKWVQASWGFDLLEFQIFQHFSFFGLSLTAMLVTLATFFVVVWPIKRLSPAQLFFLAVIFVSQTVPMNGTGFRSQTLSGLFFAITMIITYVTFLPEGPFKYIHKYLFYSTPLLFLIWANIHGGFSLGLIFATMVWGMQGGLLFLKNLLKKEWRLASGKIWLIFGGLLVLSWLLPFINPWGLRIYEETFKHSTNANLTYISEWMPLGDTIAIDIIIILTILCLAVALVKRKLNLLPFLFITIISSYMAITAGRFLVNFGILVTIFIAWNMADLPKWQFRFASLVKMVLITALIVAVWNDVFTINRYLLLPDPRIATMNWDLYCNYFEHCSEGLTQAMLKDPPKGNGFHPYNYGGYLSWRVPMVKTFIDGRMSAWEDDKGNTPPVITADQVVFEKLLQTYHVLDAQYHFQWMIVPTVSPIANYLNDQIKNGIWERRYSDEHLSYYVKIHSNANQ